MSWITGGRGEAVERGDEGGDKEVRDTILENDILERLKSLTPTLLDPSIMPTLKDLMCKYWL